MTLLEHPFDPMPIRARTHAQQHVPGGLLNGYRDKKTLTTRFTSHGTTNYIIKVGVLVCLEEHPPRSTP